MQVPCEVRSGQNAIAASTARVTLAEAGCGTGKTVKQWGREVWESDPWGRAFAGLPTDSSGDFAWVQHMVKSMAPRAGAMIVVLPQGALFRGGIEDRICRHLLEQDHIEAVICLAPNLF